MRIAHRGSGLKMTFNEPFVAGKNASSWRTNNPLGQENQRKTSSKRCYVTLQTVREMGTSLQRKDFWDRLGGQYVQQLVYC